MTMMETLVLENVCAELTHFIQSELLDESVQFDADMALANVGVSSLSTIEIVLFLERKYDMAFAEGDLIPENLYSVRTLAQCVLKNIG
jgi:acyl carrier protein